MVKIGTMPDPAAAPRTSTGAALQLSDYVPATSATGALIERTFAAGPEFVAADTKYSAPEVVSYQCAAYHQLEVAHVLQPLRPGDAEFHFGAIRGTDVVFETDRLIVEIPGPARPTKGRSLLPVRESQIHCEFVSALSPEIESQSSHLLSYTKAIIGIGFKKVGR
jgi:hypothetical protein